MSAHHWFRRLFERTTQAARKGVRRKPADRNSRKPNLEPLEAREVPAQFIWNGQGADRNWGTGANWQGGTAPSGSASDDLVFPANPAGSLITNNQGLAG